MQQMYLGIQQGCESFVRRGQPETTIVDDEQGKFIFPPGGSFLAFLSTRDTWTSSQWRVVLVGGKNHLLITNKYWVGLAYPFRLLTNGFYYYILILDISSIDIKGGYMARERLQNLTEPMYYILLALTMKGMIWNYANNRRITDGRVLEVRERYILYCLGLKRKDS